MADIFPLQQDVNRNAALHMYFRPQVAKSRNGISIIWRAGRPSGWALPRILVKSEIVTANSYNTATGNTGSLILHVSRHMHSK